MPKITFLGAGSTIFAKNLLGDLLSFPELVGLFHDLKGATLFHDSQYTLCYQLPSS